MVGNFECLTRILPCIHHHHHWSPWCYTVDLPILTYATAVEGRLHPSAQVDPCHQTAWVMVSRKSRFKPDLHRKMQANYWAQCAAYVKFNIVHMPLGSSVTTRLDLWYFTRDLKLQESMKRWGKANPPKFNIQALGVKYSSIWAKASASERD